VNDRLYIVVIVLTWTQNESNISRQYITNFICKKIEHFTLCVKDNDTTKTANIKLLCYNPGAFSLALVLLLCSTYNVKIVRICDLCDRNPLKCFKIKSH